MSVAELQIFERWRVAEFSIFDQSTPPVERDVVSPVEKDVAARKDGHLPFAAP